MDVDIDKSTPWVAAGDGNLDLMRLAINKMGLPPTAADPNGFTLVHAAAAYCRVDVLRYLLAQERVNPNAIDADGDTPLHHCDEMRAAIILIDEGKADPTIQNKDGKTARAVAEEELREMENALVMGEDDNGDEDRPKLKELVDYLKSFEEDGRKSCSDGRYTKIKQVPTLVLAFHQHLRYGA